MRILGLYQYPDHVCFRYRLRAYRPYLEAAGHDVRFRGWPNWWLLEPSFIEELRAADLVIVQRRLLSEWRLQRLRRVVKTLAFDFDDAVYRRESCARRGADSGRRRAGFARMLRAADIVVAGNQFLREQAMRWTSCERVHVVPTCLDTGKYSAAAHQSSDAGCRLVWIGCQSTLRGLERISKWLDLLGKTMPPLNLKVICDRPIRLRHMPTRFRPWEEATEAAELADADIGISWLPPDAWSQGKCGLKILQYMAAGLPVVANPIGVQADLVRHGETGFLADTVDEWRQAVRRLADDPVLRRTMGARARRLVARDYHVTQGAAAWLDLLKSSRLSTAAALPVA